MFENTHSIIQSPFSTKNHILNALPKEDLVRLLPDLEFVEIPHGKLLYLPEEPIEYVYFLNTATISVITTTSEGQSVEAGVIGQEGLAGFNVLMGAESMPNENIAQIPGTALRVPTPVIKREFKKGGALQDLCLSFINALILQIGQTALCNRLHTNEERLAKWLLMCRDRAISDELKLTQEFLAIMLGANRSRVTMAAIALQGAGYIKYSRGCITVTDRAGLADFTCECYRAVKKEYDRLPGCVQ